MRREEIVLMIHSLSGNTGGSAVGSLGPGGGGESILGGYHRGLKENFADGQTVRREESSLVHGIDPLSSSVLRGGGAIAAARAVAGEQLTGVNGMIGQSGAFVPPK